MNFLLSPGKNIVTTRVAENKQHEIGPAIAVGVIG
jgi:hypothetical protein